MFSHIKEFFTRPSGYTIARSVRLRSSASAYFNRTPASAGNRRTWTWSAWVKRGTLSSIQYILCAPATGATGIRFNSNDTLYFTGASATQYEFNTTQVFRDPSAWYHFVISLDTTQATSTNRLKMYLNGVQITSFSTATYPSLNLDGQINDALVHYIGQANSGSFFDGYITEINFIDGQALTPSSFGETDSITGAWKAKKYSGTYGTNGFYLNFSDNSSNTATTIGKDYSGNGNNWTPNNISVTAGATYDSMQDVPTLTSATAANYWTFNPLIPVSGATYSNGNLQYTNSTNNKSGFSSPLPTTGKWYWEGTWITNGGGSNPIIGISQAGYDLTQGASGELGYRSNGNKFDQSGTETAYGATWTTGDVIGVAVDMGAGTIVFYKNGTSQGTAFTTVLTALTQPVSPMFRVNVAGDVLAINFGQRPFTYTPPTGFVALNTWNLPDSTIKNGAGYMAATTYTGTGATQTISNSVNGISFQPDWVWTKARSAAIAGLMYDSVRGATKYLQTNSTAAEGTGTDSLTAFASNGFTVGADTSTTGVNQNTTTYIGWQWKAGGTSSSNTNGSITSTVSVGATQGFSVVTYTGNSTSGATVGHGLGVAPSMVIVKARGTPNGIARSWFVYHSSLGGTQFIYLDLTSAAQTGSTVWNNTNPSSTVFTLGNENSVNMSANNYVAYCFAAVAGFSAFGSYSGNSSTDGPFVFTGFRPRWIMMKCSSSAGLDWNIVDTSRNTYNVTNSRLWADLSNAEDSSDNVCDITSNGFKLRSTNTNTNSSGSTFIYMAFAENAFKFANAR